MMLCNKVAWCPNVATQICLASENDSHPAIQVQIFFNLPYLIFSLHINWSMQHLIRIRLRVEDKTVSIRVELKARVLTDPASDY